MDPVRPSTRLSELRRRARMVGAADGQINPAHVRSIQQSLRVEGYPAEEESILAAGKRVLGE